MKLQRKDMHRRRVHGFIIHGQTLCLYKMEQGFTSRVSVTLDLFWGPLDCMIRFADFLCFILCMLKLFVVWTVANTALGRVNLCIALVNNSLFGFYRWLPSVFLSLSVVPDFSPASRVC